jgi:hypothetical protein
VNKSMVLVRKMAPANWNILWLRELENMELSYDLQFDREYDDTLAQGCHLTFSALAVSGDLKGEEVIVYFKKVVGDRTSGDAYVVVEEGLVWMDTYIDDYTLSFVAMMYEKAQLSNKPLGLWYRGEPADCRRFQYRPAIRGSRVTARYLSMSSTNALRWTTQAKVAHAACRAS